MHIIRDVYLTFSSFVKRLQDYNNYRKASQNMNSRYPDATGEDLSNDNTCIVCREAMVPWTQPGVDGQPQRSNQLNEGLRAKKLPCGHILHLRCLKAWLERQQACPTCRRPVIPTGPSNTDRARVGNQGVGGDAAGAAQQVAQPGAPNAGNGNGNGNAQPQNRLRMIRLGPIRIGVYNGPANQVQEALNQRRAQQNGNAAATTTSAQVQGLGGLAGARSGGDTQLQLLQVEERLMQEAQRLQIEQSQLATVRALEAELARLRAHFSLNQAGQGSMVPPAPRPPPGFPNMFQPFNGLGPGPGLMPQAFQPRPGQAPLTAGQEGWPPGLSLPEGWTLTPLHRVDGPAQPNAGIVPGDPTNNLPLISTPTIATPASASPAQQQTTEQSVATSSGDSAARPPPPESNRDLSSAASEPANSTRAEAMSHDNHAGHTIATPSAGTSFRAEAVDRHGGGESSGWGFDNVEADAGLEPATAESPSGAIDKDKGKGKAATVEDAEEAEE